MRVHTGEIHGNNTRLLLPSLAPVLSSYATLRCARISTETTPNGTRKKKEKKKAVAVMDEVLRGVIDAIMMNKY